MTVVEEQVGSRGLKEGTLHHLYVQEGHITSSLFTGGAHYIISIYRRAHYIISIYRRARYIISIYKRAHYIISIYRRAH